MKKKTITLATFHRHLALRVAVMGAVVALLLGGLTYYRQRAQVIDNILERVVSGEETMDILEEGCRSHFDPRVLDAFASIAQDLFAAFVGREDQVLKDTLETVIQRYFSADAAIQPT